MVRISNILGRFAVAAAVSLFAQATYADDKPVVIGLSAPLQVQSGRDALDGARLAVDELNAKGGILGRKIKLVSADEGGRDNQEAVAAVRKLIAEDKPDVLIGAGYTGAALAQVSHVMSSKTLFLTVNSAAVALTDLLKKDREKYKYFFRISPLNSTRQSKAYVDLVSNRIKNDWGFDKVAIVGQNAKFVQDLVPLLKAGLSQRGVTVTQTELFEAATTDFSPVFSRVKESGAQFMLIFLVDANADSFVKQWYDVKLPIPIGGLDVKSQDSDFFTRIGGKSVSEIVAVISVDAPLTQKTQPFLRLFEKTYKRAPVYSAGSGYDAVQLYAAAAEQAKQLDSESLIPVLERISFVGVAGGISFDELHDVKDGPQGLPQPFLQWQADGSRTIVWPPELANAKLILPPWMQK